MYSTFVYIHYPTLTLDGRSGFGRHGGGMAGLAMQRDKAEEEFGIVNIMGEG